MITKNELIKKYNTLCEYGLKIKTNNLDYMNDDELFIFIAGKTMVFGLPYERAIANATFWLKTPKKARETFEEGARARVRGEERYF